MLYIVTLPDTDAMPPDDAIPPKPMTRANRRRLNARHKRLDRAKTESWHRAVAAAKKTYMQKGRGRAKKYKGEVMPTAIALNDRCSKGWSVYGSNRETIATAYIYDVT